MKKTRKQTPLRTEVIKNVRIERVNIKVSWEPSCCQLVTIYFSDPDGTLTRHYEFGGKISSTGPYFTIPFFKNAHRHTGRIHTSLVALSWILDQQMYVKAEGELLRVKAEFTEGYDGARILSIGNILLDRWLDASELPDIPYPYCISRSEYVKE